MQTTKIYFAAKDANFTDKIGQFVATDIECAKSYLIGEAKLFEAEISAPSLSIDCENRAWKDAVIEIVPTTYFDNMIDKEVTYNRIVKKSTEDLRLEWENTQTIVEIKNIGDRGPMGYDCDTTNYWVATPDLLKNVKQIA